MDRFKVLIVDDDPHVQESLLDSLELLDIYEATGVSDARQALEMISDFRPEGILLDQRMPGMTGVEFLGELGKYYPGGKDLPVVYGITAEDDGKMLKAAEEGVPGLERYVPKPWPESLFSVDFKIDLKKRRQRLELESHLEKAAEREREIDYRLQEAHERLVKAQSEHATSMAGAMTVVSLIKHSINNIGTGIGGWLYTMGQSIDRLEAEQDSNGASSDLIEQLRSIRKKLSAQMSRVTQCTQLMNIVTGKTVEARKRASLAGIVDSILETLPKPVLNGLQVQKEYEFAGLIHCYPLALRCSLFEVINNRLESLKGHGSLRIGTRFDDGYAILELEDSGQAHSQEPLTEKLFFRETEVRNGLAVANTIITTYHGGHLEIHSPEGNGESEPAGEAGSRVEIRLPCGVMEE